MPHSYDTVRDWLVSNRLYEDNLFYYALIICFWFFWGFAFLGFEVDGYNQTQNLFFNFLFYLFVCAMMALCPFWFKLFFSKTRTAKREQELHAHLDELDDDDRQEVIDYLTQTGGLAMRPVQRWALVFLGSYFLFEVFFISAWVKEMTLVWQPDWVLAITHWVKENINLPPLNVDRKLFLLNIHSSSSTLLRELYETEMQFLNSEFGITTLFFHFIKALNFASILIAVYLLLSNIIGWAGINRFNADHQEISFFSSLKKFLWLSFLIFFLFIMVLGGFGKVFMDIETTAEILINITAWVDNFFLNIGYAFFIIALSVTVSWFKTGVLLAISITDFIKQFFQST